MIEPKPLLAQLYEARRMAGGIFSESSAGSSQVVAVCNQKGGCGKTTTAISLAAGLALKGHPTLLIDLDPQAHASLGLGFNVDCLPSTIYNLFQDPGRGLEEIIQASKVPNLAVAPASTLLSGAHLELATVVDREQILRQAIRRLGTRFRFLIIDCSPTLNLLTINALSASDFCLVPLQPHYYALEGMKELFTTIELIQKNFNPDLRLLGIVPVLVDGRSRITREILGQIRDYFKSEVMESAIRLSPKLIEASIVGQPAQIYAPRSCGAQDYTQLVDEVLIRIEKKERIPLFAGDHGTSEKSAC